MAVQGLVLSERLVGHNFFPVFVVEFFAVLSEVQEGLQIVILRQIRESNGRILQIFILDQLSGGGIRSTVGDVLEILQCYIRMTHEIDEFLRIFLVGSILRDYPAIDPDIGAFLGNYEIQILIFAHNIKSIAGEHNTHGSLATDHFITYLIYYIGLYQRLLGNQILCGNL